MFRLVLYFLMAIVSMSHRLIYRLVSHALLLFLRPHVAHFADLLMIFQTTAILHLDGAARCLCRYRGHQQGQYPYCFSIIPIGLHCLLPMFEHCGTQRVLASRRSGEGGACQHHRRVFALCCSLWN